MNRFVLASAVLAALPATASAGASASSSHPMAAAQPKRGTPVPAPGGLWLFAAGLAALGLHLGRRRRR